MFILKITKRYNLNNQVLKIIIDWPMKNSVLLPSNQAINKTVSRTNRINSIQIIKNIKRDVPRSNMFSLPKTQPTKNSSYLLYDLNNSHS